MFEIRGADIKHAKRGECLKFRVFEIARNTENMGSPSCYVVEIVFEIREDDTRHEERGECLKFRVFEIPRKNMKHGKLGECLNFRVFEITSNTENMGSPPREVSR